MRPGYILNIFVINWLNIVSQYIESFVSFVFQYLMEENVATALSTISPYTVQNILFNRICLQYTKYEINGMPQLLSRT